MPGAQPASIARPQKLRISVSQRVQEISRRHIPGKDLTASELSLVLEGMMKGIHNDVGCLLRALLVFAEPTLIGEIIECKEAVNVITEDTWDNGTIS